MFLRAMLPVLKGKEDALLAACAKHRVLRMDLIGSAARGEFDPAASDLDFLVVFEDMSPRDHAEAYLGLIEDLETLFALHVDLVEEKAIKNPVFQAAVQKQRVPVYG